MQDPRKTTESDWKFGCLLTAIIVVNVVGYLLIAERLDKIERLLGL